MKKEKKIVQGEPREKIIEQVLSTYPVNRLRLRGPKRNWLRVKWPRGERFFFRFLFTPSSTREPVHRLLSTIFRSCFLMLSYCPPKKIIHDQKVRKTFNIPENCPTPPPLQKNNGPSLIEAELIQS